MVTLYRWIYSLLLYLLLPLGIIRILVRARKAPAYNKRWGERFAFNLPEINGEVIWFHTVSVGETLAAMPVIRDTLEKYPDKTVLVTTMTPTGSERVKAMLGDQVVHCYAPIDLPDAMARFFRHVKPQSMFIMETELWLNMIHQASINQVPVVLMNARLSEKSAKGYERFPTLTNYLLSKITHIAVQNSTDAKRFERLCKPAEHLTVTGNIKFDLTIPNNLSELTAELAKTISSRPVWLAASTHDGEEEIILAAHRNILKRYPDACCIIVPRHPERFVAVYDLCVKEKMTVTRRSLSELPTQQVYLADTMGELLTFCYLAAVGFVGGSLIERGGHNCLEVSAFAKPVISGKHDFNFAEINQSLSQSGALVYVTDAETLSKQVIDWFDHPEEAKKVGAAGYQVVENNRGALDKLLGIVAQHIPS